MSTEKSILLLFYLTILSFLLSVGATSNSNYAGVTAEENGTCYKRVPFDDEIAAKISQGTIKVVSGSQQVGVKTSNTRGWVTIIDCCEGFKLNSNTDKCEARCEDGCFGGTCTGPNICTCENGWRAEAGICKALCRRPCPENAYCFSPDICTCKFGYEEIDGICRPICLSGCRNGDCVAPRECRCRPGYYLNESQSCEPLCEGGCPHGECVSPGVCRCESGYVNPPNDQETCVPQCPHSCKNGDCFSPNICTCKPGYLKMLDDSCIPQCRKECVNGYCVAPDICKCNPDFTMNYELRKCTKISTNQTYENRFEHTTVPSDVLYGHRDSTRPLETSQIQGSNDTSRRRINQTYDNLPVDKAHGTQGITQNRNYALNEKNNAYEIKNQNENSGFTQGQNPQPTGINSPYNYKHDQTRTSQGQGPFPAERLPTYPQDSHNFNSPRETYDPLYTTQKSPTAERLNETKDMTRVNSPHNIYENNQSYRPQRPVPSQGPFPAQNFHGTQSVNPTTQRPYDIYIYYDPNEPIPASNPQITHDNRRVNQGQDLHKSSGPFEIYRSDQTHRSQMSYNLHGPYPAQEITVAQDSRLRNNFAETQGIKTSPNRPNDDRLYRRPGTNHNSRYPEGELSYGYDEMYNPSHNTRPLTNERTNPTHRINRPYDPYNRATNEDAEKRSNQQPSLTHGLREPYDTYNHPGNDGIGRGYTTEYIPGANQHGSMCDIPCLNGECVGRNQCACKRGYGHDPLNPYGNKCLPICYGGCLNGVCSAPNFCICNLGFIKEFGVKGAQKCVPATR